MKFDTKLLHATSHDPLYGAVSPPIYATSTYAQEAPGKTKGYDYTRAGNPNFTLLEKTLADLEKAKYATCFASGLGALTAMAALLNQGDSVLAIGTLYGGTWRLFNKVFARWGIIFKHTMDTDLEQIEKLLAAKPRWLLFETPSNPLLGIIDIGASASLAKKYGALTIVDNTFATPYCQNPLQWGADIVWHSSTKYLNGHSDVIGGVVITNNPEIKQDMDFLRMSLGINPSPFDAWLILRGLKTLALRMERQQANALAIAQWLQNHPKVSKVFYPALASHPNHDIAKKQMTGFSGLFSAEFNMSPSQIQRFVSSLSLFTLAESLGGVESLICHPTTMTHASIPPEQLQRMGINEGLMRFSCGIEDCQDLIIDLEQNLELVS